MCVTYFFKTNSKNQVIFQQDENIHDSNIIFISTMLHSVPYYLSILYNEHDICFDNVTGTTFSVFLYSILVCLFFFFWKSLYLNSYQYRYFSPLFFFLQIHNLSLQKAAIAALILYNVWRSPVIILCSCISLDIPGM